MIRVSSACVRPCAPAEAGCALAALDGSAAGQHGSAAQGDSLAARGDSAAEPDGSALAGPDALEAAQGDSLAVARDDSEPAVGGSLPTDGWAAFAAAPAEIQDGSAGCASRLDSAPDGTDLAAEVLAAEAAVAADSAARGLAPADLVARDSALAGSPAPGWVADDSVAAGSFAARSALAGPVRWDSPEDGLPARRCSAQPWGGARSRADCEYWLAPRAGHREPLPQADCLQLERGDRD